MNATISNATENTNSLKYCLKMIGNAYADGNTAQATHYRHAAIVLMGAMGIDWFTTSSGTYTIDSLSETLA